MRNVRLLVMPSILGCLTAALWRPLPPRPRLASRTVIDERAHVVEVRTPTRVQAVFMGIGLGPYLLATRQPVPIVSSRSPENVRVTRSDYLQRVFPNLERVRLPLAGSETGAFNLETMLMLEPDIVVTWARLAEGFERIGLSVAGVLPVTSTGRLERTTALYADIVGNPQRGSSIIARSRAERAAIASEVAATTGTRPRLLLLLPLGNGRWQVGFGFRDVIAAAGGFDIGASLPGHAFLDDERVIALAPDVIVIIGSPAAAVVTPTALMARPALASVPAVRARRVYATPPGVSGHMMTTMELPIQERWLADILHPDALIPGAPALATRVYATELGVVPSAAEIDRDLATAANAGSAGGGR